MDLLDPVTLVVKAPNQKIDDQTIECALGWTIGQLKRHLSRVYPSKPTENQQKLVYSGKLLHDSLVLKDILRKYGEDHNEHTLHLVCSPSKDLEEGQKKSTSVLPSSSAYQSENISPEATPTPQPVSSSTIAATSDGVRQRHVHNPMTESNINTVPSHMPQYSFQQYYNANPMMMGNFYPGMFAVGPEQMMAMQQWYTQQMAQYMQLYQQGVSSPPFTPETSLEQEVPPANAEQPQPANVAAAPAAARRQADQGNMVMNAQGGMVDADDEDIAANRDWLDWVYMMTRFAVLLAIVYFYSTLGRFLFIFSLFLFFYLYQTGWLKLRRNANHQPENGAAQERVENQEVPNQQDNTEETEENASNDNDSSEDDSAEENVVPNEPIRPSGIAVAWSFVSTFFSSLVPQQPVAVNAN